ncbi:alpha-ketoglutarate transmembrane transporter [Aureococcus anophagefferens]|nr:alpha-ketoglutarate transmembrane transporter [Aureococcus anophagefferens]
MLLRVAALACLVASTAALQPTLWQRCAADAAGGCVGGLAKALAVYPLDRAATRLELGAGRGAALRGGFSLFDGFAATLARNVPYNAASFGFFALLRARGWPRGLAGVGAGVATAVATHPIDVVDARQQTARLSAAQPPPPPLLSRATARGLARDPGALLRGLAPRVLSIAPSTYLFFAVFGPVSQAVLRRF